MSFLSPVFLAALPLLAVPVIIHLLSRRRRQTIEWGAMSFLLAGATPQRRLFRLKDLLLLLLRVFILAALIGALSRPVVQSGWLPQTGSRDVILIMDVSMSTARKVGATTLFERQMDEAIRVIEQLNSTDSVRVLLAGPVPQWLSQETAPAEAEMRRQLIQQLRGLEPAPGSGAILESLQEALRAPVAEAQKPRIITLISDGQAHSWRPDQADTWAVVGRQVQAASPAVSVNVVLVGDAQEPIANLAVERVEGARGLAAPSQPILFTAVVRNHGTTQSEPTLLSWFAEGQPAGISTVPALDPGAATRVSLETSFDRSGLVMMSGRLESNDQLPLDDQCAFLLEVVEPVPVLVMEEEPFGEAESESDYFLAALGYPMQGDAGRRGSVFSPRVEDSFRTVPEDIKCIVIPSLNTITAEMAAELVRFVERGGGLWIALGPETNEEWFNRTFYATGLVPVRLAEPVGTAQDRETFFLLRPPPEDHPATQLLSDFERIDLDRARIYRRHQFESGGVSELTVLLALEHGQPLAVEKIVGRGRVIIQAVPLGLAWSNLPLCQAYVALVHEWLWYLMEPQFTRRNLEAGDAIAFSIPGSQESIAWLRRPAGNTVPVSFRHSDERAVFRYGGAYWPGLYSISAARAASVSSPTAGGEETSSFYVRRNARESDLTLLSEEERQVLSGYSLSFGGGAIAYSGMAEREMKPIAEWLLLALLLALLGEMVLAGRFSLRRRAAPAVMSA